MVVEVGRMLNDTARLSVLCSTLYMNCTGLEHTLDDCSMEASILALAKPAPLHALPYKA